MHGHTTNALVGRGVNCSLATILRLQPFHLSCGDSLTHTLNSWHPFVFTIPDVSVRHFSAAIPFITFLFGGSSPHHPFGPMAVEAAASAGKYNLCRMFYYKNLGLFLLKGG
jgi:hypothetical protein